MCSFCTREMDSRPPPTTQVIPSSIICLAAVATAIRPEEHWRSIVIPDTDAGRPAAIAATRATFRPWVPCCRAAPMITSSTSPPSTPARSTAPLMAWAAIVGASVSLNIPR